jgi:uncharacterized RDD family membrane protein YckC
MNYPVSESVAESQRSYVIASFGWRLGAYLLDGLGIVLVAGAIGGALRLPGMVATTTTANGTASTSVVMNTGWGALMIGLVSAVYCVGMWVTRGATAGQLVLGMRVFRETSPDRLDLRAAVIRWALLFGVISLLGAAGGLGSDESSWAGTLQLVWLITLIVTTARDPLKQGFHDHQAGSLVIRAAGASAPAYSGSAPASPPPAPASPPPAPGSPFSGPLG